MSTEIKLLKKINSERLKKEEIEVQGKRKVEPNLIALSNALDDYYFVSKLKVYCAYLSYTQIVRPTKLDYTLADFKLVKHIIAEIEKGNSQLITLIIYNKIRMLYESIVFKKTILPTLYADTYQLIKSQEKVFTIEEKLEAYSFLSNFCIRKINEGESIYRERHFLLNNEMLNLKYLKKSAQKEILPANLFKNMVSVAIYLRDNPLFRSIETLGLTPTEKKGFANGFDWVKQFIEVYHLKLEKSVRQIYCDYCTALLFFFKEDYLAAYRQLNNPSHIQELIFNLDVKMLHLKILYELNFQNSDYLEKDQVDIKKVLEAYRGLIRDEVARKRQLGYQLAFYKDFEKAFRKLYLFYLKYEGKLDNGKNLQFMQQKERVIADVRALHYSFSGWVERKIMGIL